MTGQLRTHDDDGGERCASCGAEAAGPCAACRRPVCGDCCTLTEGGASTWAICLRCERANGRSLAGRWLGLGAWLVALLVALALLVAVLERFAG